MPGTRRSTSVPASSTPPDQPGATASVASGSSQIAGPSIVSPGAGSPRTISASCSRPRRPRSAASARRRRRRRRRGRARSRDARRRADGDELDRRLGVAVAVALLVQRLERVAEGGDRRAGQVAHRQLVGLAAVADVVGDLGRGVVAAASVARAAAASSPRAPASAASVSVSPASRTVRCLVAAAVGGGEAERARARPTRADRGSSSCRAPRRSPRRAAARRRRRPAARSARGSIPLLARS